MPTQRQNTYRLTIVSGGQTGADRAALDWAIAHGVRHRGWCPKGRRAEDGEIDIRYQLQETPDEEYVQRQAHTIAADLDVALFHDIQETDLDTLG